MSSFKPRPTAVRRPRRAPTRRMWIAGVAIAIVSVAMGVGFAVTSGGPASETSGGYAGHQHGKQLPPGYRLTGETSPMGAPILATPGSRSGTASSAGVVADGADMAMGYVPLAYAVKPTWQLRNTTDRTIVLGPPKAEVVKGCCPGELELGTTTLGPGSETMLAFPLQMHEGMDGWHDFRISVPVEGGAPPLQLSVTGDFS